MKKDTNPGSRVEFWFTKDTQKVWMDNIELKKLEKVEPKEKTVIFPGVNGLKNAFFTRDGKDWDPIVAEGAEAEFNFDFCSSGTAVPGLMNMVFQVALFIGLGLQTRMASQHNKAPEHTMAEPCQKLGVKGACSKKVDRAADNTGMK